MRKTQMSEMTVAGNTMPVSIKEELEKELANLNTKIGGGSSNRIKVSGKKFTFPDAPDNKISGPIALVILGFITEHMYYGGAQFDDKNPTPPVCWALGEDINTLVPSENSTTRQADACSICPMNEWESGIGKSKACKNMRKLAVIRPDADPEDQIFTISVSPTGLKEFDGYVRKLGERRALPVMVITEFSFDEDRAYPSLKFRHTDPNPNAETHWARREEAKAVLLQEPNPADFQQAVDRGSRAPTATKSGGRSAGSRKV
jgi:hypothetical protein